MNNCALIQQGFGLFEPMLDLVEKRHARICAEQGIDYLPIREQRLRGRYQPHEKFTWIVELLRVYALVIWLDCDCAIVGKESLAVALRADADIGGVRNFSGAINTGALWVRNTERAVAFVNRLVRELPKAVESVGSPWAEQHCVNMRLNNTSRGKLIVDEMDPRWNHYGNAPAPTQPVQIRAFHDQRLSVNEKIRKMQRVLEVAA